MELWPRVANSEAAKRAPPVVFRTDPIAGDLCMAVGSDQLMKPDAVAKVLEALRDTVAPDARDVAR